MKKIFATILALTLMMSATAAFALNWNSVEAEKCTEYTLSATKYIKVNSDVGAAFEIAPNATAKIGDTVYFSLSAIDTHGDPVQAEVEYHNLSNVEIMDKLMKAQVIGSNPYVKICITEKTPIEELSYNGEYIRVNDNAVTIGKLTFQRDAKGKVLDVTHQGNTAEMLKDLAALGISVEDIYGGKVCMSDDILICNFGKVCNTEAVAAWSIVEVAQTPSFSIPKTGDMSVVAYAVMAVVAAAGVMLKK